MKAVEAARRLMEEGLTKEVSLVHVVQASEVVSNNAPQMPLDYPQICDDLTTTAQQILEDARTMGAQKSVTLLLEAGLPAEIICSIAKKINSILSLLVIEG